jgi:hypothetical protein
MSSVHKHLQFSSKHCNTNYEVFNKTAACWIVWVLSNTNSSTQQNVHTMLLSKRSRPQSASRGQQLRAKAQSGRSHGKTFQFQKRRLHAGRHVRQHYKHTTIKYIGNSREQEIRSTISQQRATVENNEDESIPRQLRISAAVQLLCWEWSCVIIVHENCLCSRIFSMASRASISDIPHFSTKHTIFYGNHFGPFRHFWLVMAVQLQLPSAKAEDL